MADRLISADALKKMWQHTDAMFKGALHPRIDDVIKSIDSVPTIEAEPIIRCDKCRHWQDKPSKGKNSRFHDCMFFLYPTTANDYCSKAIRKIDEVTE